MATLFNRLYKRVFSRQQLKDLDDVARITDVVFFFLVFLFMREQFSFLMRDQLPPWGEQSNWTHRWIPQDMRFDLFAKAIAYLQVVFVPFLLFFLNSRWARVTLFGLITFNVTTRVNYYNPHNFHLYFYVSLISVIFTNKIGEPAFRLWLAQIQVLLLYFISGFWKLGSLLKSFFDVDRLSPFEQLSYMVAQEFINSNTLFPVGAFIMEHPWLGSMGQILILIMEVGALPVMFFPALYPVWGLIIVGFHSFAWIAMGLFFRDAQAIVFCLLILPTLFQWRSKDIEKGTHGKSVSKQGGSQTT